MLDDDQSRELKFRVWGWIFFVVSAVLYAASSFRSGDVLGLVASVLFLVGCVVFMIPLMAEIRAINADRDAQVKGPVQKQGKRGEGL